MSDDTVRAADAIHRHNSTFKSALRELLTEHHSQTGVTVESINVDWARATADRWVMADIRLDVRLPS